MAALDTDLTDATTAAGELGISASDVRLPRAISAASDACRSYLKRSLLHWSAAYTEKVSGFGRPRLLLYRTPILSIASVTLADGTALTQDLGAGAGGDYTLEDSNAGVLYRASRWPWTGITTGGISAYDAAAGSATGLITAVYAGGWITRGQIANGTAGGATSPTLPYDLEQACLEVVTSIYRRAGVDQAIQQEQLGDARFTYVLGGVGAFGIPDSAKALLDPYVRWAPP